MLFILSQTSVRPDTLPNECPSVLFPFYFTVPVFHSSPYLRLTSCPPSCASTFFLSHSILPLQSRGPFSLIRGGREPLHKPVVSLVILRLQRRTHSDARTQVHKGTHIRTSAALLHRLFLFLNRSSFLNKKNPSSETFISAASISAA